MTWTNNWFACTQCGEPTNYKRRGEDGCYYGYCKRCRQVVKLFVDYDRRKS